MLERGADLLLDEVRRHRLLEREVSLVLVGVINALDGALSLEPLLERDLSSGSLRHRVQRQESQRE
jgi:hypothetical protein